MVEEYLFNYGVLGLWTIWNLVQLREYREKFNTTIEENTKVLTIISERLK